MATPHQLRRAQRNPAASFDHPSSVRTNCVGGIVRPSTLAVLMLIAKSNLVGCSTANLQASLPSGSCPPVRPMQAASFIDGQDRRRNRGRAGGGIVGREAVIGDGTDS